ncbi:MAG: protein-methionine-sulfoxide reductase catalytic subunit MsrP [Alphaproteobacteria bacterium]|nr:protein-methionine-sulfoxide reductase catalytic subunit MsrP [Alphaproteobacteria bacterium]
MFVHLKRGWELPASAATPESAYLDRRTLVRTLAAGPLLAAGLALPRPGRTEDADPSAGLYPAARNERYALDRPVTDEPITSRYNNFYEFGSHKEIHERAQDLVIRPWTIAIDGLVEAPTTIDVDTLFREAGLEERLYRHRCVEAWSMAIPWTGFPLAKLVTVAKPLGSAKYVAFETFMDADVAPGQRQVWYPWPYTEVVTIAEATNELAFLVTGAYGKPMAKQFGAPIRLHLPWKYGFKSIKSIVRVSFVEERPKTFWETLVPEEYGFWANVNPAVDHPRWSQATERELATGERVPTLIFNGYGDFVAPLYAGLENEPLYM